VKTWEYAIGLCIIGVGAKGASDNTRRNKHANVGLNVFYIAWRR